MVSQQLRWVKGPLRKKSFLRSEPLTHSRMLHHRVALSRKGRGQKLRALVCGTQCPFRLTAYRMTQKIFPTQ